MLELGGREVVNNIYGSMARAKEGGDSSMSPSGFNSK
jgi:hypothetical protein